MTCARHRPEQCDQSAGEEDWVDPASTHQYGQSFAWDDAEMDAVRVNREQQTKIIEIMRTHGKQVIANSEEGG